VQALRAGRSVAVKGLSGEVRLIAAEAAQHTITSGLRTPVSSSRPNE
jgi:hypothetical protein